MRYAQTLNEAQFRKVLHYCRTKRHVVRDTTIYMVRFCAELRAKEIASLKLGGHLNRTGLYVPCSSWPAIKPKVGSYAQTCQPKR